MFKNICHFVVWLDMCNCKLCIIKEKKRLFENLQKKSSKDVDIPMWHASGISAMSLAVHSETRGEQDFFDLGCL